MNPVQAWKERTRQKLLGDFGAFAKRAWKEVEPSKELQWNWHHELVAEHLMLCHQGEITRLIITQPPRSLKSKLVSVLFPAWCWAQSPGESFILCSYSDSLSEELNMARRTLLQSTWFQTTFPGKVQFSPDQNRREQYKNLAGGQAIATSTEGTMTGKGGDYLLVDDLLSPQQSYSDLERQNANRFFDSTLRSRLNEPATGRIVIICQRLHEADLVGHLLENEPGVWTHLNLPMEAETDEEIAFPISGRVMQRKAGDFLHPARFSKSWCAKTKTTVGSFIWAGQYQQRPAPAGGAIFKTEWFASYKKEPDKGQTIIALDTAYSVKKTADYSAASVWTAHEGRYYLRFVWRGRVEYPQLKRMTEELYDVWGPESVIIEEKASGQSLLQSLKQETSLPVVGVPADTDKVSRAHSVTALFESGRVLFPQDAPWLANYLHELELFPAGAHDDQVDTTTMALRYLRGRQWDGGLTWIDTIKGISDGTIKPFAKARAFLSEERMLRRAGAIKGAVNQPAVNTNETAAPASCPHCGGVQLERVSSSGKFRCTSCGKYCDSSFVKYPCPKCGSPSTALSLNERRCMQMGHQFFPDGPPKNPKPFNRRNWPPPDPPFRGMFGRFG
jgi:predicted phage terminase large subunit-like protein